MRLKSRGFNQQIYSGRQDDGNIRSESAKTVARLLL